MLLVAAVEERMRRARVDHDVVLGARVLEPALERLDLIGRYALVGAAEQTEERAAQLGDSGERPLDAPPLAGEARVEAHRARQAEVVVRRGEQRLHAAEAEADRDHGPRAGPLDQRLARGHRVGLDVLDLRGLRVGHVLEIPPALAYACRTAEAVDRDR